MGEVGEADLYGWLALVRATAEIYRCILFLRALVRFSRVAACVESEGEVFRARIRGEVDDDEAGYRLAARRRMVMIKVMILRRGVSAWLLDFSQPWPVLHLVVVPRLSGPYPRSKRLHSHALDDP